MISKLNSSITHALNSPEVHRRLADLGNGHPSLAQRTPQALRALQKAEIEKWWPIIKAASIKAE